MYAKSKAGSVPSDSQAREKLAMYVYEYLMHVGANSAAQVFLKEIGWEKTISLGDSPGFLHGWWCVFWDLYCASPEKRDTCEHSPEAKAFHDYSAATAPSPMNPLPSDGMCQGVPPGYFQQFIGPRYPHGAPRPGMQSHGPQPMMPGIEASRQNHMMRFMQSRQMSAWNGAPDQYQQQYGGLHRLPSAAAAGAMHPHGNMSMPMHPARSQWPGNPSAGGPAGPQPGTGPPGTPIMRSPPGSRPPSLMHPPPPHRNSRFNDIESRKTPSESINPDYGQIVKTIPPHQQMSSSFPMTNMSEANNAATSISMSTGGGLPVSAPNIPQSNMNGMNGSNQDSNLLEGLPKTSPQNTSMPINNLGVQPNLVGSQGTPHTPQDGEDNSFDLMTSFPENEQQDFMKIQQCMREDVKPNVGAESSDFPNFMQ